jgi:hypothetical protein
MVKQSNKSFIRIIPLKAHITASHYFTFSWTLLLETTIPFIFFNADSTSSLDATIASIGESRSIISALILAEIASSLAARGDVVDGDNEDEEGDNSFDINDWESRVDWNVTLFKSFIADGEGDEGAMVDEEGIADDDKGVDEEEEDI